MIHVGDVVRQGHAVGDGDLIEHIDPHGVGDGLQDVDGDAVLLDGCLRLVGQGQEQGGLRALCVKECIPFFMQPKHGRKAAEGGAEEQDRGG